MNSLYAVSEAECDLSDSPSCQPGSANDHNIGLKRNNQQQ